MGKSIEERLKSLEEAVKKLQKEKSVKLHKNLSVGDEFQMLGMNWKLLEISEKGYHCLVMDFMGNLPFDKSVNKWDESSLRKYLNEDFYVALADEIGEENIIPFERNLISLDGQTEYGLCEDRVSLLTVDEYRKYRGMIPNTGDYWWWLITPCSTKCNGYDTLVTVVSPLGLIRNDNSISINGVRPFCIFSSAFFESEDV